MPSGRKALITGITGQDGSFLAELLVEKGYQVHGLVRRVALEDPANRLRRIAAIREKITLHAGSLESFPSLYQVVQKVRPDECYHLAAQSFVSYSFDDEFSTLNTNINGTHYMLAALHSAAPELPVLFRGFERDVRQGGRDAADGGHPFSPALGIRDQQGGGVST